MATITATSLASVSQVTVTETTLTASDTFVYDAAKTQFLIIQNGTGSGADITIDGDAATTVYVPGVGSVDVSGGYTMETIADGATVSLKLSAISAYLGGTIALTGGTGCTAMLVEV